MSEALSTEKIQPLEHDATLSHWPMRYRPDWFAEQTLDDEGIFIAVYTDLRLIAQHLLSKEYAQPSIQATELVNEAFVKLLQNPANTENKRHLLNILGRYMRQVLVDRGRRRRSIKRDGQLTELNTYIGGAQDEPDWALFDDAMERLQKSQPILYEVFQLHYFTGLQMNDIAQTLQCSERTIKRYWKAARLWLTDRISQQHD